MSEAKKNNDSEEKEKAEKPDLSSESKERAKDSDGKTSPKRVQEILDEYIGSTRTQTESLTNEEVIQAKQEATRLAIAENFIDVLSEKALGAANENERSKFLKDQEAQYHERIRAISSLSELGDIARNRKILEKDTEVQPMWMRRLSNVAAPVGGVAGIGIAGLLSNVGTNAGSSFVQKVAAAGGVTMFGAYLAAMSVGGWFGGTVEKVLRKKMGKNSGNGAKGKFFGAIGAVTTLALSMPGTLISGTLAGVAYGAYKAVGYYRDRRTETSEIYKITVDIIQMLKDSKDDIAMPKKMTAHALNGKLTLDYHGQMKIIDCSTAKNKAAMLIMVKEGVEELKKDAEKDKHRKKAKKFNALYEVSRLPPGVKISDTKAHDRMVSIEYFGQTEEVDCNTVDDRRVHDRIERAAKLLKEKVDADRQKTFNEQAASVVLEDDMILVPVDDKPRRAKLIYFERERIVGCETVEDDQIVSVIQTASRELKTQVEKEKEKKFKSIVSGTPRAPGVELTIAPNRKVTVEAGGVTLATIDCMDVDDADLKSFLQRQVVSYRPPTPNP